MSQLLDAKRFQAGWLHLQVREFCEQSNWQGYPIVSMVTEPKAFTTETSANETFAPESFAPESFALTDSEGCTVAPENWLNLTLGQFFANANWEGRAIAQRPAAALSTNAPTAATPDFRLSVAEFWDLFPWTGQPAIAVLPQESLPPRPAEDTFTLSDLSDLF